MATLHEKTDVGRSDWIRQGTRNFHVLFPSLRAFDFYFHSLSRIQTRRKFSHSPYKRKKMKKKKHTHTHKRVVRFFFGASSSAYTENLSAALIKLIQIFFFSFLSNCFSFSFLPFFFLLIIVSNSST